MQIPHFLVEIFEKENFSCPSCKKDIDLAGVIFIGIKSVSHISGQNVDKLYVEYICPKCKGKAGYEVFELTLEQFSRTIIGEIEEFPQPKEPPKNIKPQKIVRSKISAEETNKAQHLLDNSESLKDFIYKIGVPLDNSASIFRLEDEDE